MRKISEQEFIAEYLGKSIYFKDDKHLGLNAGQLEMELKLSADECVLLTRNRYSGISKLLKDKFESDWNKTAWKMETSFLTFALRLPDRPVVLRPDVVQKILPGQTVLAYCSIPLSVELKINDSRLGEYPLLVLSKTWFGEPDEGIMGYALKGKVVSSLDKVMQSPVHAICSIEIENRSPELLGFDRLCLRTEYMGLFKYEKTHGLNTSRCRLIYLGNDRMNKTSYLEPAGRGNEAISPPRDKQIQHLLFNAFKTT